MSGLVVGAVVFVMCSFLGLTEFFYLEAGTEPEDGEGIMALLAIVLSLGAGFLVGYVMKTMFLAIGIMILGAIAGFFLGGIFFNLLLVYWVSSSAALWITLVVFFFLGAILAWKLKDGITILATSFIGSYLFVRALSVFIGGYPDEVDLVRSLNKGEASFTPAIIAYFGAIIVLFIICVVYQVKKKREMEDHYKSA